MRTRPSDSQTGRRRTTTRSRSNNSWAGTRAARPIAGTVRGSAASGGRRTRSAAAGTACATSPRNRPYEPLARRVAQYARPVSSAREECTGQSVAPSPKTPRAAAPAARVAVDTKATRWTRPGDSPLTYLISRGNSLMNRSATTTSSSTGAASSVSLISAASNSPPEATLPRASSSQNTSPAQDKQGYVQVVPVEERHGRRAGGPQLVDEQAHPRPRSARPHEDRKAYERSPSRHGEGPVVEPYGQKAAQGDVPEVRQPAGQRHRAQGQERGPPRPPRPP